MENQEKQKAQQKFKFTPEEDNILKEQVLQMGEINWNEVAKHIKGRSGRQCRERWINYLRPQINNAPFTPEEDLKLETLVNSLGKKWSLIAQHFPQRTDVSIKNRYIRLQQSKMDPPPRVPSPKVPTPSSESPSTSPIQIMCIYFKPFDPPQALPPLRDMLQEPGLDQYEPANPNDPTAFSQYPYPSLF
jgi:hypothetical protein